jgi:hypothetical protein
MKQTVLLVLVLRPFPEDNETVNANIAETVSTGELELSRVCNSYFCSGFTKLSSIAANFLDDVVSCRHFTKDNVFAIQPRCFSRTDEELTPI